MKKQAPTLISRGLEIARHSNDEAAPKAVTVRVLESINDTGIRSSIVIAGKVASPGDLAEMTEHEASDLIQRGRVELA